MNNTPKEQLIEMAYKAGAISRERREANIVEYNKSPKLCKCCGTPLPYDKRKNTFCSNTCAGYYNNTEYVIEEGKPKKKYKLCKHCGTPILKTNKSSEFCSRQCWLEYNQEEYIRKWKAGEVSGGVDNDEVLSDRVRKYMLDKVGHKCELCGWGEINPYTNKIPLEIHHKDGDYKNNAEDNLQVLCPNCHTLTKTYGTGNIGNGRYNRRLRVQKQRATIRGEEFIPKELVVKEANVHRCQDCGKVISRGATYCVDCHNKHQAKNVPSKEELLEDLKNFTSFMALGRKYGVSDNGVRKWCKKYNLPYTISGINKLTNM